MPKKKQKKRVNKFDKCLLLSWRKLWIIVVAGFVSIMLHNLIYGLFKSYFDTHGGDEAFFFIITMLIIFYFLITIVYTLIRKIINKTIFEKKFIIIAIIALIIGIIISYLIIKFTFINPPAFYPLAVIFSLVLYYLIKLIKQKRRVNWQNKS